VKKDDDVVDDDNAVDPVDSIALGKVFVTFRNASRKILWQ
jgi:hypothetical protein